ncbi:MULTISPECIES: hypothetical protein [Amycolatopsis]|uniref:hypothetical protein n=1 Tax=Amycolatopsis TaxID=1813 RepID=UPI001304043B|nr:MULTISPECIES: hypothetical protein [Amycolatopsis]
MTSATHKITSTRRIPAGDSDAFSAGTRDGRGRSSVVSSGSSNSPDSVSCPRSALA